jgi:GH35 family endo-1,4-beta-xylanase
MAGFFYRDLGHCELNHRNNLKRFAMSVPTDTFLRNCRAFACTLFGLFLFTHAALTTAVELPSSGEPLFSSEALDKFKLTTKQENADAATADLIKGEAGGPTRAWRVETRRDLDLAWAIELRTPLNRAVANGDVALIRFHARALSASDETGSGRLRMVVQKASPDYEKDLETQFTVGREWQEYLVPFTFSHDYASGAAELSFGFGYKHQVLEIGDIEVVNYGKKVPITELPRTRFTYAGRELDAAWRREALARIEQIRKGAFTVEVCDANGAAVTNAVVRIEQKNSAFQWGTALQFARLVSQTPENLRYREKALELFNAASPENDLKWPVWEGDWGDAYNHAQSLAALRWLNENKFHVRGHVLVWPGWKDLPKSVLQRRDDKKRQKEIPDLVLAHIREITTATKGLIREWDVLNEPYDHHDLMALFGNDIMTAWFKTAAECVPGLPLYLNDFSNHDLLADKEHCKNFYRTADFLQKAGAPLGGLGLQGHIGSQPNPPESVLATLDLYAKFNLPIRFTEFDINTDDEELQSDYTQDFFILAFSHPSVVGVQLWGFWEKAHWRPQSAMFRNDWSEKPNARVYRDLVLKQWRTKVDGQTDVAGRFAARGFYGDYVATVEIGGHHIEQSFTLRAGEPQPVVRVKLP